MSLIATLTAKLRTIFGTSLRGLDEFYLDNGTETVGGLALPFKRYYPLRLLPDNRKPTITSRHGINNPSRKNHYGVDLFYKWQAGDAAMRIGDGGRTKKWFIPDNTWSVAPADGLVTIAGNSRTGHRVWIQHAGGLLTGGFHMTKIKVQAGDAVKAGDPIGIVGDNPVDNDARHLHWECYQGSISGYPKGTIDPERFLKGALYLPALPTSDIRSNS